MFNQQLFFSNQIYLLDGICHFGKISKLFFVQEKNHRNAVEGSAYTCTADTLCSDQLCCYTDKL